LPALNVVEIVAFPLSLAGVGRAEATESARKVLDDIGLVHRATHYPNELSGGEMQRVAIGRAIVHRPPLILADEPTGNLDSRNGEMIFELLRSVHDVRRPTVIMATHSDAAAARGDYVVRIADGRVVR